MTFSLNKGGVVMSSQITHTQSSTYTPYPIYLRSDVYTVVVIRIIMYCSLMYCNTTVMYCPHSLTSVISWYSAISLVYGK